MEMQLVVIRVGVSASDILNNIHRVAIEVDVIFFVGAGASLDSYNQLVGAVVGDVHISLGIQDNQVCAGVVYGDTPLTLKNTVPVGTCCS